MKLQMRALAIPRRYRVVLMLLMPAAIVVAAYFLLFQAQLQEKKRLDAEVENLRQEFLKVRAMKNSMEKTRREHAALKADLQFRLRQMPEEKEVPALLRQVSLAAQETRTHVKYFAPKEPGAKGFYLELPFEMKYTGTYHSIGYFFDGIRKLERIVHITGFTLETKQTGPKGTLEGSCLAKTYVLMKELPPGAAVSPQPAKTAGPGGKNEPVR